MWRSVAGAIDWLRLQNGQYVRVEPDAIGVIESTVFPGLRLHVPSVLAHDLARLLAQLGPEPAV